MSQHDGVIDDGSGAVVLADLNNALQALLSQSSGTSAPSTTYANQVWIDTTNHVVKRRNEANSAWIITGRTDAEGLVTKSSGFTVGLRDFGKTFTCTAALTATFTAAATLGDGFEFWISNDSTGSVVLDPNSSETVNGAATLTLAPGERARVVCSGTAFLAAVSPVVTLPRSFLSGYTLANNGSDATNDVDIAAGAARDSTDAVNIVLAAALTKRLDASWAVGTNQGMLDTGAIADGTYHLFAIRRADTGVVDVLASASASSPTMPSNYGHKRRIGSIIRASGAIVAFKQTGDHFDRDVPVLDVNVTGPGTSAVTRTVSVPTGIVVWAKVAVGLSNSGGNYFALVTALDQTDSTPSASLYNAAADDSSGAGFRVHPMAVKTNTSAQFRTRQSASAAGNATQIVTTGWIDRRGRDD